MLVFVWAAAAIASIPLILFALFLADMGNLAIDLVYAMLSGSIVGLAAGIVASAKNLKTHISTLLLFAGILGAVAGWLFAWIVLSVISINLYSTTALGFDLIVGLIGAAPVCFFLLDRYVNSSR